MLEKLRNMHYNFDPAMEELDEVKLRFNSDTSCREYTHVILSDIRRFGHFALG